MPEKSEAATNSEITPLNDLSNCCNAGSDSSKPSASEDSAVPAKSLSELQNSQASAVYVSHECVVKNMCIPQVALGAFPVLELGNGHLVLVFASM